MHFSGIQHASNIKPEAKSDSDNQRVITFTANLVAETTYYVSDWAAGKTSRATGERFQVGGKGINVSKMLMRLARDTTAICFPGGIFGEYCRSWLDAEGIPYRAFTRGCATRSGSIIRAPGKPEISILGLDCRLPWGPDDRAGSRRAPA